MTKVSTPEPTQEQIEAARDAFVAALYADPHKPWHRDDATDKWKTTGVYNVDGEFNINIAMRAVLMAALAVTQ